MTHVWQAQTRGRFYLPLMRHPFCRYAYQLRKAGRSTATGLSSRPNSSATASSPTAAHAVAHRRIRSFLPFSRRLLQISQQSLSTKRRTPLSASAKLA